MHRAAALAEGKIMQRVVLSVIRSLSRICFARSWIGLLMKNLYYSALRLYLYGWGGSLPWVAPFHIPDHPFFLPG